MSTNTTAPAWVLDIAEEIVAHQRLRLIDVMLERGEDPTRNDLWLLRKEQLESLLASGKVLAVDYGGKLTSNAARFADFYSVTYGDIGSGARALTVETDEPMQIRPQGDRSVIIARA
jgi:hypothetical protein